MPVEKPKTYESGTFVQLAHTTLSNPNLSWGALGLWHYMLSKPPEWKFNLFELENVSKSGRWATRSHLKELIELGVVKKMTTRDQKGQILDWNYLAMESSKARTQEVGNQEVGNQEVGNPPPNYIDNKLYVQDLRKTHLNGR